MSQIYWPKCPWALNSLYDDVLYFLQLVRDKHSLLLLWECASLGATDGTRFGEGKSSSHLHLWKHHTVYPLGQRKDAAGHRMGETVCKWTLNCHSDVYPEKTDWFLFFFFCSGEHQHSRQCVPGVGVPEGAAPPPTSELHTASARLHIWPATTGVDQPTGILQVSAPRLPLPPRSNFNPAAMFSWRFLYCERLWKTNLSLFFLQRRGVGVVSAGPRDVLHQLDVAAAPTHDVRHQDVGSGASDTSMKTQQHNNRCWLIYTDTHNMETRSDKYIFTHTLTDPVWGCLSVRRLLSKAMIGHCGVRQTNSHTKRTLLFLVLAKFSQSVCCCIDVFFYQSFLSLLDAEVVSFSLPEFSTANFNCLL